MASRALQQWRTTQRIELDQLELALRRVRGRSAVERSLKKQLVEAYVLLLAGHFQLFCRDLHNQAAAFVGRHVHPPAAGLIVRSLLTERRVLGRGNAQSGALGADFGRLGLELWPNLRLRDPRNARRQHGLDQLNVWRNALAHRDFVFNPAQATLAQDSACSLRWVRIWRGNCSALARQLDIEVTRHLYEMTGKKPW